MPSNTAHQELPLHRALPHHENASAPARRVGGGFVFLALVLGLMVLLQFVAAQHIHEHHDHPESMGVAHAHGVLWAGGHAAPCADSDHADHHHGEHRHGSHDHGKGADSGNCHCHCIAHLHLAHLHSPAAIPSPEILAAGPAAPPPARLPDGPARSFDQPPRLA